MMFDLSPLKILVLIVVAMVVLGPEKLPTLAKDAARMLRTVRDLSKNARTMITDELGPEFGNLDLQSLNPRTALKRALFDDEQTSPPPSPGRHADTDTSLSNHQQTSAAPFDLDAT
jgi:Sec-independent protein translocase protein TatA